MCLAKGVIVRVRTRPEKKTGYPSRGCRHDSHECLSSGDYQISGPVIYNKKCIKFGVLSTLVLKCFWGTPDPYL